MLGIPLILSFCFLHYATLILYLNSQVHEKEFLLEDLTVEGFFGDDRRLGNICSKRVYRILMAQCGNIKTDDIESGADFFSHQSE